MGFVIYILLQICKSFVVELIKALINISMINNILKKGLVLGTPFKYSFSSGATFLKMVESFFDRAAVHTGIRSDYLNFYKKAENVVKCSIPLVRGNR